MTILHPIHFRTKEDGEVCRIAKVKKEDFYGWLYGHFC